MKRTALGLALLLLPGLARATELDPDRPLAPSLDGNTGVMRVYSARSGVPGYWDITGHGMYFQQRGFVNIAPGATPDYDEYAGAIGSVSYDPWSFLELFVSSEIRENYNSTRDPHEDTANGSLRIGAKAVAPISANGPIWVALAGGTQTPPNVDKIQLRGDTFGGFVTGIFTTDFTEREFPFRGHLNVGYVVDNSGKLILPNQSAARTFALNLSNRNRITYGAAFEAPFKYATPFLEIWGAKPNGVSTKDSPGFITPGVRITPVQGLALDVALDLGLTKSVVNGGTLNPGQTVEAGPPIVPLTPQRQIVVGASYSFASTAVHERQFENQGEIPEIAKKRIAELQKELENEKARADEAEEANEADFATQLDQLEQKVRDLNAKVKDSGEADAVSTGEGALGTIGAARKAQMASKKCSLDDAQAAAAEAEQTAQAAEKAAEAAKSAESMDVAHAAQDLAIAARRTADLTRKTVQAAIAQLGGAEMQKAWGNAKAEAKKADDYRTKLATLGPDASATVDPTATTVTDVNNAADAGLKANLCDAETAVSDAEKQSAAAITAAAQQKGNAQLARPTDVTSNQAKKAAAAARAALERSRQIIAKIFGPAGENTVAFRGLVLDATTFAPVGDAIVSFPDTNLSRILADAPSGFFRSYSFPPGTVNVSIAKQGYETLLQAVTVQKANADVIRFLLKKEGGGVASNTPGLFKGRIVDEKGGTVAGTLVFADAPFQTKEIETNGAFSIKMPPGLYEIDVKAPGYLLQGRRVSVAPGETVNYDYVMREIPKERRAETIGNKITLKDVINFAFNSDVIDKSSYPILDEVADIILNHPEYNLVRVEGHTDDVGTAAYNLSLSDRRARSVVNYLLGKGIPPERLQPVGWGKAKPVAEGTDDAARALNRRVEFNILQQ